MSLTVQVISAVYLGLSKNTVLYLTRLSLLFSSLSSVTIGGEVHCHPQQRTMKVPELKVPPSSLLCASLCSISEVSEWFVSSFALFQVPL